MFGVRSHDVAQEAAKKFAHVGIEVGLPSQDKGGVAGTAGQGTPGELATASPCLAGAGERGGHWCWKSRLETEPCPIGAI